MTIRFGAPGNLCGVVIEQVQGESLQEPATKVESRRRGTSTRLKDQCTDLGIVCVDNDKSRHSSWTKLQ